MWYTGASILELDEARDRVLVADPRNRTLVAVDTVGRPRTRYEIVRGRGPGELENINGIAVGPGMVGVFDRMLGRVVLFDESGAPKETITLRRNYQDLAITRDSTLYVIPGSEGHAFDRFSFDGRKLEGLGDSSALPEPCETNDCSRSPLYCIGCEMGLLDDSVIVVTNTEDAVFAVFSAASSERKAVHDLEKEIVVLAEWAAADASLVEAQNDEFRKQGQGNVGFKTYIGRAQAVDGGGNQLFLAVSPSLEVFGKTRSYEVWMLDLDTMAFDRFAYGVPGGGMVAVGDERRVFAVQSVTRALYSAAFPSDP